MEFPNHSKRNHPERSKLQICHLHTVYCSFPSGEKKL